MISVYIEISRDGHDFKSRSSYDINWDKLIEISQQCGMLSYSQEVVNNTAIKVTHWRDDNSYTTWLHNAYVQEYIKQRDFYNQQHNIINSLHIFITANGNQNSSC